MSSRSLVKVELTEAEVCGQELVRRVVPVRTERAHCKLGLTAVEEVLGSR